MIFFQFSLCFILCRIEYRPDGLFFCGSDKRTGVNYARIALRKVGTYLIPVFFEHSQKHFRIDPVFCAAERYHAYFFTHSEISSPVIIISYFSKAADISSEPNPRRTRKA